MNMMIDSLTVRFVTVGTEQYLRLAEDRWYAFSTPDGSWLKTGPALTSALDVMYKAQSEAGYQE